MDILAISDVISQRKDSKSLDIPFLKGLVDKYPYAQVFPILYLKALSQAKSFEFEEELNRIAYRITDREKLYEIIHTNSLTEVAETPLSTVLISEEIEEEIPVETTEPTQVIEVEETAEIEFSPESPLILETVEELDSTIGVGLVQEELIEDKTLIEEEVASELETEIAEEKSPIEDITETELKKENSVVEDSEMEIEIELSEETENEQEEQPITEISSSSLEINILTEAIDQAFPYLLEQEQKVEPIEEDLMEEQPELTIEKEKISGKNIQETSSASLNTFSEWLNFGKNTEEIEDKTIEKDEKTVSEVSKEEIINKFIEKNPSISRPKKEFFSAPKKAQESVDDDRLMYSETLANIYVIQGNFPLAIKAYEQLCLTIPEKRLIFAKKIEELKQKIK